MCYVAIVLLQACTTGRYLPDCTDLAVDKRAREGAVSVLRRAQQEARRHLSTAVLAFQPFNIGIAAAAGRDTSMPGGGTGGQGADQYGQDGAQPDVECDDDDLSVSGDEGCMPVDRTDSDTSDDSDDCRDADGAAARDI